MNTTTPNAAEVLEMRQFLARVMRTSIMEIKVTGDPATDENTDLLASYSKTETMLSVEKLDALEAIEIDLKLSDPATQSEGATMFRDYLAQRKQLYP
jgi:hypothetical protein